jgi:hypothetical protein
MLLCLTSVAVHWGVQAAYPGDAEVAEPAIGLLANITLRQPNAVHLCVEVRRGSSACSTAATPGVFLR